MIAATDWRAVAEQHHDDGTGRCACGESGCRTRAMAEQHVRVEEQRLLPGPPAGAREFRSVFAEGEVER